jgi:deazaflavin-dependent oxidoreductase (nitroreductase family)
MLLAKFLRLLTRFRRIQPRIGRLHAAVLKRSRGRIRRSFLFAGGQPVLALTTTGRKSGKPRSTVVAYVRHGQAYAVGALNLSSDYDPAWCLNLRADPRGWIDVAGQQTAITAREASADEAEELWERFFHQLPQIRNAREIARRDVPMLVLEPAKATVVGRGRPRPRGSGVSRSG